MNTSVESLTHKMQRAAVGKMVDVVLSHADKDRQKTVGQLVDVAKQFYGSSFSAEAYEHARQTLTDPDSKWSKLINCVLDQTDPNVARTMALNLGYEAFFRGTKTIRENRVKYQCNIPWLILFDPTSACNMHCVGCWAGEYGHKNNLSFEDMDKIVTEGKELGVYLYMLTGGEPLVRKADILKLAEKHNDVQFAIYTNSTLIDEPFCKEVVRLGNIAFMLSIEGTPETNDARRGEGHYAAVMHAMDLLKEHGIVFGTSICYTRDNIEAVTNDEFMRFLCEKGAHFGFYFHYMPVGNEAAPELMPTPEQRKYMIDRIRYLRSEECDIPFYPMDFQNDGEFVGGCIAGGRNYFHTDAGSRRRSISPPTDPPVGPEKGVFTAIHNASVVILRKNLYVCGRDCTFYILINSINEIKKTQLAETFAARRHAAGDRGIYSLWDLFRRTTRRSGSLLPVRRLAGYRQLPA